MYVRSVPCILSIRTDSFRIFSVYEQIHSAYSQYTYRFIPCVLSTVYETAKFCSKIYLIPRSLCIRTDSFCIFSVYEEIYSAYFQYTYRFDLRIRRMRPNNLEFQNGIIFFTAFERTLLQKKYLCVQLDQRPTRNNLLFAPCLTKKFFLHILIIPGMTLNMNISVTSNLY